jgi:hypothetical protein
MYYAACFLLTTRCAGQISASARLGLDMVSIPSLRDYLNTNYAPADAKLNTFETAVDFSAEANYRAGTLEWGADIRLLLNTYNFNLYGNQYIFDYTGVHPSLTLYKVLDGPGYQFRFGGGVGPRFLSVNETLPLTTAVTEYSATGFGAFARVDGATGLSSSLFAYIGAELGYDMIPAPASGGKKLKSNSTGEEVTFSALAAGVKLGVMYKF